VILLGGDPGIGKSTLLLEVAAALARAPPRGLHFREEAVRRSAARRALKLQDAQIELAAETSSKTSSPPSPIATRRVSSSSTRSRPWDRRGRIRAGTVTQVRGAAQP